MHAIEIQDLSKQYGDLSALDRVSFTLEEGNSLFVCGKNGAGKTTLLEIICGFRRQTGGTVKLFGKELRLGGVDYLQGVSAVFDDSFLYGDMTLEENLMFYGELCGVDSLDRQVSSLLQKFNLKDKRRSLVKHLSHGFERKGAILRALVSNPRLLVLDEPTSGLDFSSQNEVVSCLDEMKNSGCTVIFTSHDLKVAKRIAPFMTLLEGGRLEFFGSMKDGEKFMKEKTANF